MNKEILVGIGIAVCLFFVPAQVLYGQAEKVDPEIKQVYEYYLGQSLEDAIDSISANNRSPQSTVGDTALVSPNAPKVHSSGSRPKCYAPSQSPAIKPLPIVNEPQALSVEQLKNHYSVFALSTGERGLSVMIGYIGDIADLATLGVTMTKPRRAKGSVAAAFPLRLLPDIARHPNIERIYSGEQLEQN